MSKGWITDRVESPLVIAIIAILSITLYSIYPQEKVVEAKTNNKTKIAIEENNLIVNAPILAVIAKEISIPEINEELPIEETDGALVVKRKMWVTTTAYSSTVDQTDSTPFITASGTHVHNGMVAANFLKFGTKVRFPSLYGDRIFIVEDRMNARFDKRVDIWFPTRPEAKNFGAKWLEIEIL